MTEIKNRIFTVKNDHEFNDLAFEIFHYQYHQNIIYRTFINHLGLDIADIKSVQDIPCLPIEFFKNHKILSTDSETENIFQSSGTSGDGTSSHFITDIEIYRTSFLKGFKLFYGEPEDYIVLALLPSYLERKTSSLVFMVNEIIKMSRHPLSGFFHHNYKKLGDTLKKAYKENRKILLLGVSFALLDFCEEYPQDNPGLIVMETGGMKGRRLEMTREELHAVLKQQFGIEKIHSEYGMTELLSQAYSKGEGVFYTPPWLKIIIRDSEDPMNIIPRGKSGGINCIDLANLYSCSFIATQDLGKLNENNGFEVLGRFDNSNIRGCNLMVP